MNNLIALLDKIKEESDKDPDQCVVRISTSAWQDSKGYYSKKSLKILKSKSHGAMYECVLNDLETGNADLFNRIINLDSCQDGLYYINCVSIKEDWETGHIDDWDYELIPYKP